MMWKKWIILVLAALCIAAIFSGCGGGVEISPEPVETADPELWRSNVLGADEIPEEYDGVFFDYPVFGSEYQRSQIGSVTILDTLADLPEDAWDVSEAENGTVMAWVEPSGGLYDLYIGAEGGVSAGSSCAYLFAGYQNAVSITLGDHFATYDAMNMESMFHFCESLASLTLGERFDTAGVQDMSYMFARCLSLTELPLGDRFVTANADTTEMFFECPAGDDYRHLLH